MKLYRACLFKSPVSLMSKGLWLLKEYEESQIKHQLIIQSKMLSEKFSLFLPGFYKIVDYIQLFSNTKNNGGFYAN